MIQPSLTHPFLSPPPSPQPWVGSRAHPLDCALPPSALVPASEGCPSCCCECCYGLGVGMGARGGGLVVRRPLAGQPRLAAGSGALAREPLPAESLGPLGKALVTGGEGGRWRRPGRGLQPLVFSDPSCSERERGWKVFGDQAWGRRRRRWRPWRKWPIFILGTRGGGGGVCVWGGEG